MQWEGPREVNVRAMKDSRKIPVANLIRKLKLKKYEHPAPFTEQQLHPIEVTIPLKMNVGEPSKPIVRPGTTVTVGQKIAAAPDNKLGVAIHASIDGVVTGIDGAISISSR